MDQVSHYSTATCLNFSPPFPFHTYGLWAVLVDDPNWVAQSDSLLLTTVSREDNPAQYSILFRQSAKIFLDLRSIGIAGTFRTGNIIKRLQKDAYSNEPSSTNRIWVLNSM